MESRTLLSGIDASYRHAPKQVTPGQTLEPPLDRPGWRNLPCNGAAWFVAPMRSLVVRHTLGGREFRQAWRDHGRGETYLTIAQARKLFQDLLPGSEVTHHLLWRYSIVWRKP